MYLKTPVSRLPVTLRFVQHPEVVTQKGLFLAIETDLNALFSNQVNLFGVGISSDYKHVTYRIAMK